MMVVVTVTRVSVGSVVGGTVVTSINIKNVAYNNSNTNTTKQQQHRKQQQH